MIYFAKVRQNKNSYLVEFPELEGCFTEGSNKEVALKNAKEALDGWLAAHFDRNLNIPEPAILEKANYLPIEVSLNIAFAINLRRARLHLGLTQTQAAKKLSVSQQAYAKLESPETTNPSLSTLKKIADALNLSVDVKLVS